MDKTLIVIVGPTAIGKTSLSIQLAQHFNCEIVSADSRQFFKEMHIGTAAPTPEELNAAPHHFIHNVSIHTPYSVGDYEKEALQTITTLFSTQDYAILIGGSGLYIDAVTKGLDYFPEVKEAVRNQVRDTYAAQGIVPLQEQLQDLDPVYYNTVDIHNTQRVIRALEVCLSSGKPYSSFRTASKKERPFHIIKLGITAERAIIYDRINSRVDLMMEAGLVNEVQQLVPYQHLNALNTVGYKELFKYLDNEWELETAITEIKKNTRRFAKRQLTWFRKDTETIWFDYKVPITNYIDQIQQYNTSK